MDDSRDMFGDTPPWDEEDPDHEGPDAAGLSDGAGGSVQCDRIADHHRGLSDGELALSQHH